jgi:arabinofuranan 3-O-arabinosyltransferase
MEQGDRAVTTRTTVAAFWVLGVLSLCTSLVPVINGSQGYDTVPLTNAVHAFVHGGAVYTERGAGDFLYPPSALLLLLPLGALSIAWAGRLFFLLDLATILGATAALLRLFGFRWSGIAGSIALFGISLSWPVIFTLDAGNVNGPILLGLACFLLATHQDRSILAGIFLGLTLALKPILAPVLLVVLLYRRWNTLLIAVGIPVGLSALVLLAAPSTRSFFDTTLPLLLHGQNAQIQDVSIALRSAAEQLSVPDLATQIARAAVFMIVVRLLWRRSRFDAIEPRRLVELTTISLVGGFLISSFAFPHYGIFLLPFAISIAEHSSPHRNWITGVALFCIAARQGWVLRRLPSGVNEVLAQRFTFALLLALFAFWIVLHRDPALVGASEQVSSTPGQDAPPRSRCASRPGGGSAD